MTVYEEDLHGKLVDELKELFRKDWGIVAHPRSLIVYDVSGACEEADIILGESDQLPSYAFHVKKGTFNEAELFWKLLRTIRGIPFVYAVLESGSWSDDFQESVKVHANNAGLISYAILSEKPLRLKLRVEKDALRAAARFFEETVRNIRGSLGVAEFTGFHKEHFEYCIDYEDSFKGSQMKSSLELFTNIIRDELTKRMRREMNGGVGKYGDWAWFCESSYERMAHFGVVITEKGLGVWVNMEHDLTIGRFRENAVAESGKLLGILRKLRGYRMEIMERVEKGVRYWEHHLVCRASTDHLDKQMLDIFLNKLEKLRHSRLFVVKNFEPSHVMGRGTEIIEDVLKTFEQLHEFYTFSNAS